MKTEISIAGSCNWMRQKLMNFATEYEFGAVQWTGDELLMWPAPGLEHSMTHSACPQDDFTTTWKTWEQALRSTSCEPFIVVSDDTVKEQLQKRLDQGYC